MWPNKVDLLIYKLILFNFNISWLSWVYDRSNSTSSHMYSWPIFRGSSFQHSYTSWLTHLLTKSKRHSLMWGRNACDIKSKKNPEHNSMKLSPWTAVGAWYITRSKVAIAACSIHSKLTWQVNLWNLLCAK